MSEGKCPFCKNSYDLYDGPTPQKQGTVVCPEHGRNAALVGKKVEMGETLTSGATGAGIASPEPETATTTGGGKTST